MSNTAQVLSQKSLVVIFAYAPSGLGHLRVTKALYEGLPKSAHSLLLGSHDQGIAALHRIASLHPLTRSMMEISQGLIPIIEDITTYAARMYLRSNTKLIYEQLTTILDQLLTVPKTVLIVATHTTLAHQIAAIKEQVMKEKKVQLFVVVQVTDDTPQHIWYVPGADMTFIPSDRIKDQLTSYGRAFNLPKMAFEVNPYPINPKLAKILPSEEHTKRHQQVTYESKTHTHIAIPISGAAVGTRFFKDIMVALRTFSPRFMFHIVSKRAPYTETFLNEALSYDFIKLYVSDQDRAVVDKYDELYLTSTIGLEITKPSEQAFKALLKPKQFGGSLLLFSTPVGKQEYDNLFFLRRHNLIPTESEQMQLYKLAAQNKPLTTQEGLNLLSEAIHWRGVRLPDNAVEAAHFVWWCLHQGILAAMMHWKMTQRNVNGHAHELTSDGVKLFWEKVADFLHQKQTAL